MTAVLADPYYSDAHEVFRRSTNQTDLMLDHFAGHARGLDSVTILSVGSGAGLFEVPMLGRLRAEGVTVARFVGVDPSEHACAALERKLGARGYDRLDFELVAAPFEMYETSSKFDIVLFNHVLEYLPGNALTWVRKSVGMLGEGGDLLIFSPIRGGINRIYEEVFVAALGTPPFFADDIEQMLDDAGIAYALEIMTGACELSALERPGDDPEKLMLLSFLAQRDCRELSAEDRERYIGYYLSLRKPGSGSIDHPAALFVV